jgi:glycosyltransferase involved in cell wall biosynthesis
MITDAPILLDVSRLIWRQWTRRLPTGIDRVCLAYLSHFHSRARAVVQFRRFRLILGRKGSSLLFELLLNGSHNFRSELAAIFIATVGRTERTRAGQIYLNVGHTGLNSPHLGPWLSKRGLRSVFLVHDLIPINHPQYCREGEAARHVQRVETALRSANGLILNSAATARELVQFARARDVVMPPTLNAWLGIDTMPANSAATPMECRRPYFVMIGTIEARKNHLLILQAWREIIATLGDQAPSLVVIGQRGWEAAEAIAILDDPGPLEGHVHEMSGCDDAQMSKILAGARAMLMPSFVEGFGLPLVEALREGVPVIASDLPVFREIAGDIPTYLNPHDHAAWVKAIIGYTGNSVERRRQLNAARSYRAPSWTDHFALVEEFLERI